MKIPINWLQQYVTVNKSAKEIADSFTALGLMLDKPLGDGKVLDLEHRMDRSDWLSIVGCARDLAAIENEKLILPKLTGIKPKKNNEYQIPVTVECPDCVKRFTTRIFKDVKVGASPKWLKESLEDYGIASINNIVDITNYVMIELGQPLHAQDIDKLNAPELTWRFAKNKEKLTTFLGTELELDESMFVMTSGGLPVVLGGIVGGAATGVTSTTTNIILDAGNYNQRSIRTTSRKLHINNETVLRSDKFLDPRSTEIALARATQLILEIAGGTYYEGSDYYPDPVSPKSKNLRLSRLYALSGINFTMQEVKKILTSLNYQIVDSDSDSLVVEIPYFRTDVEVEDDLVADILRINNYKNIPTTPITTNVPDDITPSIYIFEERLRDLLTQIGADEHITTSFVEKDEEITRITLENALTEDASALRLSIEETLAPVLANYKKHKIANKAIFEIGLSFSRNSLANTYDSFHENRELVVLHDKDVRSTLATLMHELGIDYDLFMNNNTCVIKADKITLGTLTLNSFTLKTTELMKLAKSYQGVVSEFRHLVSIDLSLTKQQETSFGEIKQIILESSPTLHDIEVLEAKEENLLVRLTWDDNIDYLKEKRLILQNLQQQLAITSRSHSD